MGHLTACRHPGCAQPLSAQTTSGVCRRHNHSDYCLCGQCRRRRGDIDPDLHPQFVPPDRAEAPDQAPPPRPGVRSVSVTFPTSNSCVVRHARVSLPREPWEAET